MVQWQDAGSMLGLHFGFQPGRTLIEDSSSVVAFQAKRWTTCIRVKNGFQCGVLTVANGFKPK